MSNEYLGSDKKFEEGFVPCQQLFSPYQECVQTALKDANVDLSLVFLYIGTALVWLTLVYSL